MEELFVRKYGRGKDVLIALHGGPAAAGDLAPLAQTLSQWWPVLEPFQRANGGSPLSVARHVQDLDDLIRERCQGHPPVLVGHSWGAMLALAYAAHHPGKVAGLVLIGCGTFSEATGAEFKARLDTLLTTADRAKLARITSTETTADRRLAAVGRLMAAVYGVDIDRALEPDGQVDAVAHQQTWGDMLRLQHNGTYPAAFGAIRAPVLMLHGDRDPHPGKLIQDELMAYIPHLEYHELPNCGHSPWLERQARDAFFARLVPWVAERFRPGLDQTG